MKYPERLVIGKGGRRQVLVLLKDYLMMEFAPEASEDEIGELLKKHSMAQIPIPMRKHERPLPKPKKPRPIRKWVKVEKKADAEKALEIPSVIRMAPLYVTEGLGVETASAALPDVLLVEIAEKDARKVVETIEKEFGLELVPAMTELLGGFYYFKVKKPGQSIFDLRDRIEKLEGVSLAEIDWLPMQPLALVPNDTHFDDSWHLETISAIGGWDLETGRSSIVIAIIDQGCDLTHPDLQFVPQADHFNSADALDGDPPPYNAAPIGNHGTAVAGIAAALLNNGAGVSGVAGGCLIMPLATVLTSSGQAASINWAVAHGAHVINMSYGGGIDSTVVANAITNAANAGVILVAAAHNHNNNSVTFPARYPEVIAVGATDQDDERKRPASTDGECWGSNHGDDLDVMAPGVLVWTTDRQGANGYNSNNGGAVFWACVNYASCGDAAGDYYSLFDGTSAAAPQVSGLAGLLLSYYSRFTRDQVREIIERTCRKASPDVYDYAQTADRPNGSWHQEMGYGIISVYCALRYARAYIPKLRRVRPGPILGHEEMVDWIWRGRNRDDWPIWEGPEDIWPNADPVPDFHKVFPDDREKLIDALQIKMRYRQDMLEQRMRIIKKQMEYYKEIIKTMGL